jgi:light-regulated signal transduction histidine kinase (bacteriophytochrome)
MEFMQNFDIKAKLAVPILLKEQLWGLLVAHQCNCPRHWSSFETDLLKQLADQIGIALAQAQLLEQETHQRQELARSNTELENFAHVASDYLERMQKAAERMQTLIHDLLTLSRITTQAQPFVAVDLAQIVQDVLSDLEVCLEQNQGQVEVGELPTLNSDPLQMRQLMQNLIGNALKFHRKGELPKVRIYSQPIKGENQPALEDTAKPTHCQICVEDNGIGFDTQYLDRIFQAFHRLHGRNEYEGTGMGLAICRKIVERHNGNISAHSTQGQGSTFIVTLPLQQR